MENTHRCQRCGLYTKKNSKTFCKHWDVTFPELQWICFKGGSDVSTVVGQPRHQTEMAMRASFSQVCMENPTMNMFQEL